MKEERRTIKERIDQIRFKLKLKDKEKMKELVIGLLILVF